MQYNELEDVVGAKGLKIIHVNTRSVLNKLDELKLKLASFDIIVFTETWLTRDIDNSLLDWEGFNLVRQDRDQNRNKKGGGVCVYIRNTIRFSRIVDHDDMINQNLEFIMIRFKSGI